MYKYLTTANGLRTTVIMLNSLPVCTFILDDNAKLVDVNQAALDFLSFDNIV